MKIKYLGHACIELKTNDFSILIDPFISGNPLASDINVDHLKPDYIFITHAHQDHILDVETIAHNSNATIISSFEIANYYDAKNLPTAYLNVGANADYPFGKVNAVAAVHSSSFPDGKYGGLAQGYVFEIEDKRIYISGDTAVTEDMKLIPQYLGKVDLAVFPIGNVFTMDYKQACIAADFVDCPRVLGSHYDTFPPITINHEEAKKYFKDHHRELILLKIGDYLEI